MTRSGRVRAAVRKMDGLVSPAVRLTSQWSCPRNRNVTLVAATSADSASLGDSVFAVEKGLTTTAPWPRAPTASRLCSRAAVVKTGEAAEIS